MDFLLDHQADANVPNDADNQTSLHWGCVTGSCQSIALLLEKGNIDLMAQDIKGNTSFHIAAINNQLNTLHYLVLKSSERDAHAYISTLLDCVDFNGRSPLHWASYKGHEKVVMYLLSQGVDINLKDKGGMTPLHWASQRGYLNIANLLVFKGSDVMARNEKGLTAEELAIKKSFYNVAHSLGRAGVQISDQQSLENPNYFWLWGAAPFIYLTVFIIILSTTSIMASLFYCFMSYLLIKMVLNRYWLGEDFRNPILIGWFSSLFVLSGIVYYFFIIGKAYMKEPFFHILFHIIYLTMLYTLYKLTTGDPGHIEKVKMDEDALYLKSYECGENPKLCTTCHHRIPLRGKHCRSCNKCVARMDHHCGWINHCVGQKNHKRFLLFVLSIVIASALFQKILYSHLKDVYNIEGGILSFITYIPSIYQQTPIYILLLLVHFGFSLYEAYLFYDQLNLIASNVTLVEGLDIQKVPYFWQAGSFRNPFDIGHTENIMQFIKDSVDWSQVYTTTSYQMQPDVLV